MFYITGKAIVYPVVTIYLFLLPARYIFGAWFFFLEVAVIRVLNITRTALDVRSSGDRRKRVDAYFVAYWCPADEVNPDGGHEWICRFEVPRGAPFSPVDYPSKKGARAACGWYI